MRTSDNLMSCLMSSCGDAAATRSVTMLIWAVAEGELAGRAAWIALLPASSWGARFSVAAMALAASRSRLANEPRARPTPHPSLAAEPPCCTSFKPAASTCFARYSSSRGWSLSSSSDTSCTPPAPGVLGRDPLGLGGMLSPAPVTTFPQLLLLLPASAPPLCGRHSSPALPPLLPAPPADASAMLSPPLQRLLPSRLAPALALRCCTCCAVVVCALGGREGVLLLLLLLCLL
mmetsp:Transcript_15096/g.40844  ORF Transcript_15096/g.40844 Transcript_15096/m.40844 type:complete len:233 (-) Transcript_15096:10-708(-)